MISTAEDVYKLAANGDTEAILSLELRGVLLSACEGYIDEVTGAIRPVEITRFMRALLGERVTVKDRIYRIIMHSGSAIRSIMPLMRERIARERTMLHIKDVREVDDGSVRWLSRQPGRNLREKLAGKPFMLAVRRYMTFDTAENRLFKELMKRLSVLLELRENALKDRAGPECSSMLAMIRVWLKSEEASEIGQWKNVPPNNTLLRDKRYRKVWEAWTAVQALDAHVIRDYEHTHEDMQTLIHWRLAALLVASGNYRTPQQPLTILFDDFTITPKLPVMLRSLSGEVLTMDDIITKSVYPVAAVSIDDEAVSLIEAESVAVDLSSPRVRYTDGKNIKALPFRLALQSWDNVPVMCDDASALFVSDTLRTVTVRSVINGERSNEDYARLFAARLHDTLRPSGEFAYLIPDHADDFDLAPLRRAVNSCYPDAVPVPVSIAALISQLKARKIPRDIQEDSIIIVFDFSDEYISLTPVMAKRDDDSDKLASLVPDSGGVIWERHPPLVIKRKAEGINALVEAFGSPGIEDEKGKMSFFDVEAGGWTEAEGISLPGNSNVEAEVISGIKAIRNEHKKSRITVVTATDRIYISLDALGFPCRIVKGSKLEGAFTLREWQKLAGDIELWRDHLPELLMTAGMHKLELVKNKSIVPTRNKAQPIKVDATFELPAGKSSYRFGLQKGRGREKLRYAARLSSPAFPLSANVTCMLELTYTYGASQPYELTFRPLDKNAPFKSVRAEWIPVEDVEPVDPREAGLSSPLFPKPHSWSEFADFPTKDGQDTHNLLEWFTRSFSGLRRVLDYDPAERAAKRIQKLYDKFYSGRVQGYVSYCGTDRNGKAFYKVDAGYNRVFVHSSKLIDQSEAAYIFNGSSVWVRIDYQSGVNDRGEYFGRDMSLGEGVPESVRQEAFDYALGNPPELDTATVLKQLRSIRFPLYTIWNGHSLSDYDAPSDFRNKVRGIITLCQRAVNSAQIPDAVREELYYIMCCLGRDAPEFAVKYLADKLTDSSAFGKYSRHIAYSIGSANLAWQRSLLDKVITNDAGIKRNVVAAILAASFWRSEGLIFTLKPQEWQKVADALLSRLRDEYKVIKNKQAGNYNSGKLARMLELLLALLRSRDDERLDVRMLLAPYSERANAFTELVELTAAQIVKKGIAVKSFVEIELAGDKPDGFKQWDNLLYALHVYLDVDAQSEAGTIMIKGFSEDD